MAKAAAARAKKIKHKSYEDKARILQCCLNGIPWKQIRKDFSTNNGIIGRITKIQHFNPDTPDAYILYHVYFKGLVDGRDVMGVFTSNNLIKFV